MFRLTLWLCAAAAAACAGPIATFTFSGTGTGSLGLNPFTNAALTLSGSYDISNVTCSATACSVNLAPNSVVVGIAGIGSGFISAASYLFDDKTSNFFGSPVGLVGFGVNFDILQMYGQMIGSPVYQTYDLTTAIGPLGPQAANPSAASWSSIATSSGLLTVSAFNNFTFRVTGGGVAVDPTAPEPGSMLLLGAGFGAIGLLRYRRRQG